MIHYFLFTLIIIDKFLTLIITAFSPLRENQTIKPFRVYLDRLVVEDMQFNNCVDHRQTQPFDYIVLYYGWLACGSRFTAPHLLECVMQNFSYTQTILKHYVVSAHPALTRRQIDDVFAGFKSHLVSKEARNIKVVNDWSYVEGYIRWFFMVSHPYMVHAAPGDPPKSSHQEIHRRNIHS